MKKIACILLLLTLGFSTVAFCQGTTPMQNVSAKLKALLNANILEGAYLHFDRPYYSTGDTMYFKAYVTLGEHHNLSKASGILHVDLVNPGNVIIRTMLLQLNNGIAWGDFSLPDTLQGGAYRVRAYTRYMENTPDYFFDKTISITAGNNMPGTANTTQTAKADLQFFPEGGELVTSLISRVAFKAIGTNGMSIGAKGVIVDNANLQVATFASNRLGMGSFTLQPEAGKTYKAKVTFADGTQNTVDLPVAAVKGIVLQIKDTLDKASVNIICNKAYFLENQNKDVSLIFYSEGKLSSITTKLDSRVMGLDVAKNQYPSGVLRITLFSQDGEPLSERLVFLQGPDMLNIAVSSAKTSYKPREHVEINVNTKSNNAGDAGFLSAAVINEAKVPYDDNNETTILSYLLLTSELKGYIEQPNYYFANKTDQARKDLDNLMLTQGYRRFNWKELLSTDPKPFTMSPEKSLYITGIEKNSSGPVAGENVMMITGSTGSMLGEKTDNAGKFTFDNLPPFYDGTSFTLQATGSTKTKKSTTLAVDVQPEPPLTGTSFNSMTALPASAGGSAGNAPVVTANADQQVSGDDISSAASLTAGLSSHLNGVSFVSGIPYLKGVKYPMLIVVDGKVRGSNVKIDNLPVSNVKDVELLKGSNASAYGSNGSSGVLIINTRYGSSGVDLGSGNISKYQSQTAEPVKESASKSYTGSNYRSSNIAGPGHADQVVSGDVVKNSPTLSTGLNGILHGVDFVSGVPYLRGGSTVSGGGASNAPMYIVIDGVESSGGIDNISPHSVETIEVLRGANASIYGSNGGAGVLIITTRNQSEAVATEQSTLGSLQFKPKGFYKAREFYSPKYNASSSQTNGPDERRTIYWNPNLVTDNDGNAAFEFYNSDGHGSYRVIVEGIDGNGNVGWQVYRYKVE